MEIGTSHPHHVLVVSDSLALALIRTTQSTKTSLLPISAHLGFGAGVKCGCDYAFIILRSQLITNVKPCFARHNLFLKQRKKYQMNFKCQYLGFLLQFH